MTSMLPLHTIEQAQADLIPCVCGKSPDIFGNTGFMGKWAVSCSSFNCHHVVIHQDEKKAIALWNAAMHGLNIKGALS